ncbi:unnamed protein product [Kuraishia capsulata CBS 1993]|uniref:Phospholipid-transporting ATPase n=1 Tax=Kuraishia capsulata CBS 1993 TaxID=1382522 RepID=W6MXI8_9ASCO|nr:uncharacterized protein KUCA_T00004951001 [Kuraishia capsulata CBS 1993]CDK28965.1 unnamed protein product [Kuraishia capsulata CBS 1993]
MSSSSSSPVESEVVGADRSKEVFIDSGDNGEFKTSGSDSDRAVPTGKSPAEYTWKDSVQMFAYKHNIPGSGTPRKILEQRMNEKRHIMVNLELAADMLDEHGNPATVYPRNKIRTTKYTPLTFLPKNIVFQFTNIANSYFLLIVILGAFQIFGVPNPVLSAVPLIVIVCLTAIRDAFEDYRRGESDMELNNSRVHLLVGLNNPNVRKDYVGPWRRFKKACSRTTRRTFKGIKSIFKKDKSNSKHHDDSELQKTVTRGSLMSSELVRPSTEYRLSVDYRPSTDTRRSRVSRGPRSSAFVANTVSNPNIVPDMAATKFENKFWKDVCVGDVIRVRNNEEIPADAVILATSNAESDCYVETKNLDGETNLKHKKALHCGQGLRYASDFQRVQMAIETEPPNANLYKFRAVVHFNSFNGIGSEGVPDSEAINIDNILLRGSSLRNTKWALCLVLFTGSETKVMLNSGITPNKKSRLSSELNFSVVINFTILFIMCFASGLVNGLYYDDKHKSRLFFEFSAYAKTAAGNGTVAFFVALIIYQSLVPISLYISIEIIKTIQAFFIFSDVKMYYDKLDFPCIPKSWNISDDLGQIEYIFSDKTGTLTQNVMEFKKCTIAGKSYGLAYTEAQQGMQKRAGIDVAAEGERMRLLMAEDREGMLKELESFDNDQLDETKLAFISKDYVVDVKYGDAARKKANEDFMSALALCHTVITEADEDGKLDFKAESPDEAALVAVAKDLGIVFRERTRAGAVLQKYNGDKVLWKVLEIVPFNSTRKRMSVLFEVPENERGPKGEKIMLISKGADNVIYERLSDDSDQSVGERTAVDLEEYAKEGLRTLCIARKYIDEDVFREWQARYKEASNSVAEDREEKLDIIGDEIESDLFLLGGTAIEDRLQDGVPSSIAIIRRAGIKLWVLTGDKIETAINIGFSCNLLDNSMNLLVIRPDSDDPNPDQISALIKEHLSKNFGLNGTKEELEAQKNDHSPASGDFAVIIDGSALMAVFDSDGSLQSDFLLLCKQCKSVLCCRVSPAQKASVVKLVKNTLGVMTLAIGDGANDVAMIQAANVGVGIAGEEGRQAVMSADYAIAQFRFLTRLVLVHGRWSYKRLAEMIPCFFYKNVTFSVTLMWYGIYCNFDGTYLFEFTYLMFYNLAFTSLPVIFLAFLDQDVSDTVSLLVPELYRSGILRLEWSQYKFVYYVIDGLYQSVISFYFPYLLFRHGGFHHQNGMPIDHRFWMGVYSTVISVTSCNAYVLMQQKRWDWLSVLIVCLSTLFVFFWTGVWSSSTGSQEFYKVASQVFGAVSFWACFFCGVLVCLLPRFVIDNLLRLYRPRDIDIIRERVAMGDFKDYPEGYDPTDSADVAAHRKLMQAKTSSNNDIEAMISGDQSEEKPRPRRLTLRGVFGMESKKTPEESLQPPDSVHARLDRIRTSMSTERGSIPGSNYSQRIRATHDLPGLTNAESLVTARSRRSAKA